MKVDSQEVDSQEMELFLSSLSLLLSWRLIGSFRATVRHRSWFEPEDTYDLIADTTSLTCTATNRTTGVIETYDGYEHTKVYDTIQEKCYVYQMINEPLVARLAFPMSLPIWGRWSFDSYRFTGKALRDGENTHLELAQTTDPQAKGTLTINIPLRMAVRLDTPEEALIYEDIRWT